MLFSETSSRLEDSSRLENPAPPSWLLDRPAPQYATIDLIISLKQGASKAGGGRKNALRVARRVPSHQVLSSIAAVPLIRRRGTRPTRGLCRRRGTRPTKVIGEDQNEIEVEDHNEIDVVNHFLSFFKHFP